jgi:MYXO-CTERM domain-containing protein
MTRDAAHRVVDLRAGDESINLNVVSNPTPEGTMNSRATAICLAAALCVTFIASEAAACVVSSGFDPFRIDSDAEVTAELEKPTLRVEKIKRGTGPKGGLFTNYSTSCDDLGYIEFSVEPSSDKVGHVFTVVDGEPPGDIRFPEEPVSVVDPSNRLYWGDEAKNKQEPFEFTLTATPIAKNGEPGPTSDPVTVSHPGSGGCSTTGQHGPVGAAWLVVLAGILAIRSRSAR